MKNENKDKKEKKEWIMPKISELSLEYNEGKFFATREDGLGNGPPGGPS